MTLGMAFLEYGIKLIVFAAVAAGGIFLGIKIRKNKNAKSTNRE